MIKNINKMFKVFLLQSLVWLYDRLYYHLVKRERKEKVSESSENERAF